MNYIHVIDGAFVQGITIELKSKLDEPIVEGMVFTVEPGIYILEENLGIRIENNIVVTKDGQDDLFKDIPPEVEEIEALMARGKKVVA